MPRYVVLTHTHPFLHWDLMLECGKGLRTWRLLQAPEPERLVVAEPLADHRRDYLDYEGPVSGGRGEVRRWETGRYTLEAETPERIELRLEGERMRGRAVLAQTGPDSRWTFYFRAD